MKRNLYVILAVYLTLVFSACSSSPKSPEKMEAAFLDRFEALINEGNFSKEKIEEVWLYGDAPESELSRKISDFEELKEQGLGEARFHEIYPKILEGMNKPFELEGEYYLPNIEPYKMVEFVFSKAIEVEHGKENGWSMVVGVSEGKLYLMGYRKAEPIAGGNG